VLTRHGGVALLATLLALLFAVYTLNLLLLVGTVAVFAVLISEILLFELSPPDGGEYPFEVLRPYGPRVVSPGVVVTEAIRVTYRGGRPLRAEVRELLPPSLTPERGRTSVRRWWAPGSTGVLDPSLRTAERGSHHLGPVAVLAESPHGLAWTQWIVPSSDRPLRVVPPAPIERSHRIGPALLTQLQGRIALRHRGYGTEFRSLRPYSPDDDLRHVAWKRSRPGQWYVREFDQENRQDFVILLDLSSGMAAGLPGETALDRAVEAGSLVTAAVARSGEDRIGFMAQAGSMRQYLRPARGERYFRLIAENLAYARPATGNFDLPSALEFLTRRLGTVSHVLAFSALDGPMAGFHLAHARFRARGHRLYLFPPMRAAFYPAIDPEHPAALPLAWARNEEGSRLGRRVGSLRGEGVPIFPYDRRGATAQVLSTYGQLRAWGMA
jgi:uncharacterized protein (DUF58 family)